MNKIYLVIALTIFTWGIAQSQNNGGSSKKSTTDSGGSSKLSSYKANDKLLETLGVMSAQGMYNTYLAIGALADAYVKGAYTKEDALTMTTFNIGLIQELNKSLKQLIDSDRLNGEDVTFVKGMIEAYTYLEGQATGLKDYIDTESTAHLSKFETNRKSAWAKISSLLGIE